jgi:hypothetical protein
MILFMNRMKRIPLYYRHDIRSKTQKKSQVFPQVVSGYLTVYVALSMAVLLSLFLILMEGVRRSTIRLEAECVMDIGMNSILAEYHREMLWQYNLFYIDNSYGTNSATYLNTQAHLQTYLERNLSTDPSLLEHWLYRDLLAISLDRVQITGISLATDSNGANIRRQAIEAVKDDVGLTLLEELIARLQTLEAYGLGARDIAGEKKSVDRQIQSYDGMEKDISEEETITIDVYNPTDGLETKRSAGILHLVVDDTSSLSRQTVSPSGLPSARHRNGKLSLGNMANTSEREGIVDKLIFGEYLLRYCDYYGNINKEGKLDYQIEYLIAGKDNDLDNLKSVVHRISALREAANVIYLYSDSVKCMEAEALAATLSAAMLVPEIAPLLKTTIILGWAYAESLYDVKSLLAGDPVPLMKNASSWRCDLQSIFGEEQTVSSAMGGGLYYQDYLRLLLALTGTETLTFRFLDIVETDIRITKGNEAFRVDGCVDGVSASAHMTGGSGYSLSILRTKKYVSDE